MKIKLLSLLLFSLCSLFAQNQPKPFLKNGKWGYVDKDMNIVIPCIYDQAYPFFEDRALVQYMNYEVPYTKSYFINSKGEVVIHLNSSAIGCPASRFQNGVALVEKYNITNGSNLCVIDKKGKIIHKVENAVMESDLSLMRPYSAAFNKDGIYIGQIHTEGKTQSVLIYNDERKPIILDYPYIAPFNGGYAVAKGQYREGETDSEMALINTKGKLAIAGGKYQFVLDFHSNPTQAELLFPISEGDKCGYVDERGQIKIEPQFDLAFNFSEGMALVGKISGTDEYDNPIYRYGYIDTMGNLAIPYDFIQGFNFREGLAEVALNDSVLFIDKKGNRIFSFASDIPNDMVTVPGYFGGYVYEHGFINGYAILYSSNKVGFINRKGEFAIKPFYYGLFRIGPSLAVNPIENGIVRLSPTSSLGYEEYYVDQNGMPLAEQEARLLPAIEGPILCYKNANINSEADTLSSNECPIISKLTGKKDEINGKQGEWIKINRWGEKAFVFSADFNTNSLVSVNTNGSELYETESAQKVIENIAAGTILFLAPEENINNVGSDKMIKVILFTYNSETASGYLTQNLWIKAKDIKIINKPK